MQISMLIQVRPSPIRLQTVIHLPFAHEQGSPPLQRSDDGDPVAQDFRKTGHDFGRVVAHTDDGIGPQLLRMLAHEVESLGSGLLAKN